jgi:hypothetical protein
MKKSYLASTITRAVFRLKAVVLIPLYPAPIVFKYMTVKEQVDNIPKNMRKHSKGSLSQPVSQ